MAASVVTVTPDRRKATQDRSNKIFRGDIDIAAGDYATPGLTCSLAVGALYATRPPTLVRVNGTGIYRYTFVPGTTLANGKLKIFDASGEVPDGATPAGVVADVITFEAVTTV